MDCIFAKHTAIATSFFSILCEKIKNLLDGIERKDDKLVENRIKHCIVYYTEIIRYVSLIENTFSYGILVQFTCSAIVICLTGFQLTLMTNFLSAHFILMATYFWSMTNQLTLYCWNGHLLMEKSDQITQACYHVNWYEMRVNDQKLLITIMERAKQPVAVKAIGVFCLNLATLMSILRSSYSYFAVLHQIFS
uniref:Odorant receptor 1 n=1 Tax=Eucryptorrhynchus brandti TaxID=436910 RepID=A0A8F4RTA8_EUCBR|nr:odorant receptor 1 [Eucryptorrhynchus brandti]